jgi:hypothetical protein
MAADFNLLVPELSSKAHQLIDACKKRGVDMRANIGLRDPFEQGKLWRQSRSIEEITTMIDKLRAKNAPFLAHCIDFVGAQHGDHVTDTPPGISWHQWGEALDFFWLVEGKAEWSTQRLINGANGYKVLAEEAEILGLTAGGHFKQFKDWPHVQRPSANNAANVHPIEEINSLMEKRFSS